MEIQVARSLGALPPSPKLMGAGPQNHPSRATIAFLESDRPDGSGAGDPYGDAAIAPDLPEEIGRRLVEERLLNPKRFWLSVPPPSVSAEEERFSRHDRLLFLRQYRRPRRG
jgi:hypothetical protein